MALILKERSIYRWEQLDERLIHREGGVGVVEGTQLYFYF